jgi:hypothetical protein
MYIMSKLFESGKINGMELSNRFVRSATWEGMAADALHVGELLAEAGLDVLEISGRVGLHSGNKQLLGG